MNKTSGTWPYITSGKIIKGTQWSAHLHIKVSLSISKSHRVKSLSVDIHFQTVMISYKRAALFEFKVSK